MTDSREAESGSLSDGEWRRTSPLGIFIAGLLAAPKAFLALLAAAFGGGRIFDNHGAMIGVLALIGLVIVILGITMGITFLIWRTKKYRIGTSDIKLEQGIIARSARSVPFERIQDVSLEQKLLPRLLGLVEVRFETGAGGKDELKLTYVTQEQGEALRETIRARLDGVGEPLAMPAEGAVAAQAPAEKTAADIPLFAMDPRRLLTFGIFEFSLAVLAVLFAATQQFDFFLPFAMWDFQAWGERLSGPGAMLMGLGIMGQVIGGLFAFFSLIIIGLVTGIIRTVLRDYDFRLEKTPKGFRRRRGLLTRTDVVMPVHRVQAVTVSTGLIRRLFGWHGLSFISLAQDAKSANHDVAPFAKMEEIAPIAEVAGLGLPSEGVGSDGLNWHRPAKAFRIDSAILGAIFPLIGATVSGYFGQPLVSAGLILLASALAGREYFLWRYECFALDDVQIYSRQGWLAPKLTTAQRPKLHSVEIVQGPIAGKRGYCDLRLGLAGGKFSFDGLELEDAEKLRTEILASIAKVDFAELAR